MNSTDLAHGTVSDIVIAAKDLTRNFTRRIGTGRARTKEVVTAVSHLNLTVAAGESVGYIGANGAGKSTTIKMLTGILLPTSGTVQVCGFEPVRERTALARHIGVVFGQRSQLWWDLPLRESFEILSTIHRLSPGDAATRMQELRDQLELGDLLDTPVRQLSLGQRMRGEVAAALLHRPRIIILDEPTIGLDVVSKERLRQFLLHERAEHGTTLMLTTHDMGDIERLCDRVVVVDQGSVVHDGTLNALASLVNTQRVMVVDLVQPCAPMNDIPHARLTDCDPTGVRQSFTFSPADTTAAAVLAAVSARAQVRDLTIEEPSIESIVRTLYEGQRSNPTSTP